jgi:hypothetical protein
LHNQKSDSSNREFAGSHLSHLVVGSATRSTTSVGQCGHRPCTP